MPRLPAPLLPPPAITCQHCRRAAQFYRLIISSGAEVVTARCVCGRMPVEGKPFFSKSKYAWGDLPLADDMSLSAEPCAHCGSKSGTEWHHWAPKHLFEDPDNWPGDYLCKPCHKYWHDIVTPEMRLHGRIKREQST